MKQRLLSILSMTLIAMAVCHAQNFEFQYQGKSVPEGGTVSIAAEEDIFGFGELWCESNPSDNPGNGLVLKLLTTTSASGVAKLTIEHNTVDPGTLKWCMGGTCNLLDGVTMMEKGFSTNNGIVLVQFDAENLRSTGYLMANLSATIAGESHSVKVEFTNGESTGMTSISDPRTETETCYSVSGTRLATSQHGINIIRMSDGTTRKVLVR